MSPLKIKYPLQDAFLIPASSHTENQEFVNEFVKKILNIYQYLSTQNSLLPSPHVNEAFGKLVSLCTQVLDESIIYSASSHPSPHASQVQANRMIR